MRLLLDTHVLLWAIADPGQLGGSADLIRSGKNEVYFSSASIFEIAIKHKIAIEKDILELMPFSPAEVVDTAIKQGFKEMKIDSQHACALLSLKYEDDNKEHKDPFDRLLISQAKVENLKLLTADSKMKKYQEDCILSI